MSVETEKNVTFHQEVSSSHQVAGLFCVVQRDQVDELADSSFQAYMECHYDLGKTKIVSLDKDNTTTVSSRAQTDSWIVDKDNVEAARTLPKGPITPQHITSKERHLILTSIPQCDDILIRGASTRVIACDKNPKAILLHPDDRELVVRAAGKLPKHIQIAGKQNSSGEIETHEVHLEEP